MVSRCPRGCPEESWEVIEYDHGWDYRDDWKDVPNHIVVSHCDACGEDWDVKVCD